MRLVGSRPALIVAALFMGMLPQAASAQDYAVKFERPAKAGEQYRYTVQHTETTTQSISIGGGAAQEQKTTTKSSLVGDVTVAEVTDTGRTKKLKCKIEKLEGAVGDAAAQPLVPAGQTIVISRNGKEKVVTLEDGTALPAGVDRLVEQLINVDDPEAPDDDASFGSKERRKVGDAWDADPAALAAGAARQGITLSREAISGKVRLVEVRKEGDVEHGVFEMTIAVKDDKGAKLEQLPPGVAVESLSLDMTGRKSLPTDATSRLGVDTMKMTMNMTMTGAGPDGTAVKVVVNSVRSGESRMEAKK